MRQETDAEKFERLLGGHTIVRTKNAIEGFWVVTKFGSNRYETLLVPGCSGGPCILGKPRETKTSGSDQCKSCDSTDAVYGPHTWELNEQAEPFWMCRDCRQKAFDVELEDDLPTPEPCDECRDRTGKLKAGEKQLCEVCFENWRDLTC